MTDQQEAHVFQVLPHVAASRISRLQRDYLDNKPGAVSTLAKLRHCEPVALGANPDVWAITLGNLPDALTHYGERRSDDPTSAEQALFATLVLFALHAQSQGTPVHVEGVRFGAAVARLARARAIDEELDTSTVKRLQQAALATTPAGRLQHLMALIKLMRAETPAIGFDYGQLAVDLWRLFDQYQDKTPVLVRWARDLHARPAKTDTAANADNEETK